MKVGIVGSRRRTDKKAVEKLVESLPEDTTIVSGRHFVSPGDKCLLGTSVSWRQGWKPLEPLVTTHFGKSSFRNYINDTLQERSPRLVVMECPAKHWFTWRRPVPQG